ncbi:hypothetical protein DPMN_087884 [Dreissena polymorpha]|uniref:Uncharacterized protein n=1 Tax=Dreissena polymorpha TaxID=45954 RepID=A0A9D4KT51_DREPO|nr:hypothetical protein DPMN_087884 [Dreissena polymorpha]
MKTVCHFAVCLLDSMNLMSATLQMPDAIGRTPPNSHWQERLDNAQNLLFCKELFAQVTHF